MKKIRGILLLLFMTVLPYHFVNAQNQKITKAKVTFEFLSKNVKGTIAGFKSNSVIDTESPKNSVFEGSVAVETLNTNNGLRNWSLKSRKYFYKSAYPRIHFKSTAITIKDDDLIVKGTLTLKGVEKPLTFVFERTGKQLEGKASLYASDFGINIMKKREDNLVKIAVLFDLN